MNLQQTAQYEVRCPAFHRKFDKEKFKYEFHFHVKEQLLQNYFNHQFSTEELEQFNQFSRDISGYLNLDLPIFVHRDFQSSNIFYQPGNGGSDFQIIDFQDARSGHPLYDLVSLLWDSYVDLSEEFVNMLIKYFHANYPFVREQFSDNDYEKHIDYLVIQRKLHDAGAFAYTFFLTQNNYYIQYIKTAISMAQTKILKYKYWPKISGIFQKILETENV
jgi:aminoglycoside/choline kinase family phosphotransferase